MNDSTDVTFHYLTAVNDSRDVALCCLTASNDSRDYVNLVKFKLMSPLSNGEHITNL